MKVENKARAFEVVYNTIGAYELDKISSESAGYRIYRSKKNFFEYACDLGDRIEVNTKDGKSFNVWITDTAAELKAQLEKAELEVLKLKAQLYDLLCK